MNHQESSREKALVSRLERLRAVIHEYRRCIVAFSGGVDSCVLAKVVRDVLGRENCLAVTAVSPSLSDRELAHAVGFAREIDIQHEQIQTREFSDERYLRNDGSRCFFCKSELYGQIVEQFSSAFQIVNGTNLDDLGDYRPGLAAAEQFGIKSPLAECDLSKEDIRQLAQSWGLKVWSKPASPCLSSRIAYEEPVDPRKLKMVEQAEAWLMEHGFEFVRVRYHKGDHARIEVPVESIADLVGEQREPLIQRLREIGFAFISLDLEGFRSGSLNRTLNPGLVQIGTLPE